MAEQRPATPTKISPSDEGSEKEASPKIYSSMAACSIGMGLNADQLQDNFEDAAEITPKPRTSSPDSGRSLTDRRPSGASVKGLAHKFDAGLAPPLPNRDAVVPKNEDAGTAGKSSTSVKSHRISVGEMDEVNLEEGMRRRMTVPEIVLTYDVLELNKAASHSRNPTQSSINTLSSKIDVDASKGTVQGLSGLVTMNEYPPPPSAPERKVTSPEPPTSRSKFASPFSWLSRATSGGDKKTPPPIPSPSAQNERRGTISSMNSSFSNPEMMLGKITEGQEMDSARNSQSSLKDRFKMLRMREEAGINLGEESAVNGTGHGGAIAGLIGRSASIGFGVGSPTAATAGEKDELQEPPAMQRVPSSPGPQPPQRAPAINTNLAPGTASGMTAGPSATPVDWDLWQSVVYEGPAAVARANPEELNQAIVSGIPQAIRGVVWQVLAKSKDERLEAIYHDLVARGTDKEKPLPNGHTSMTGSDSSKEKESVASSASSTHSNHSNPGSAPLPTVNGEFDHKADPAKVQKLEKTIKRDLGARTSYSKYVMAAGLQDGLFGVCKAYALYDNAVGYAQGMNFIAMPLLFNMPEEEAFCMMVRLMYNYGLREMFLPDMAGLHLHLYQFSRLLEDLEPALYCHLHRRGVEPQLYATQWFLTLFAYRFPLQLVLRIYDLILSEGLEGAILKFGVTLMIKNKDALLGMRDMSALTTFLKERLFDVYIDKAPTANSLLESGFFGSAGGVDKEVYRADILVQDACAVKLEPEQLKLYTTEWEEQRAAEKAREDELESLRSENSRLAQKVRSLEERAEKSDTEHVQMASELVRKKVDNETLSDENESLRGQVSELKAVVERQTQEVEERLRGEMDKVMQRNSEVHAANRALEDEKAEFERELVQAKMGYAQVSTTTYFKHEFIWVSAG